MKTSENVSFRAVDLRPGFWLDRYNLNKQVSMENVRIRFEESGRFDALRFNFLKTGRRPHIFYDSDAAKWMEAVAYHLSKDPNYNPEHRALCEELIDCMERAQRPNGYLNSTHQQNDPDNIFKKRGNHELYCAGHLIEAAIAWHIATGSDRFLSIMERYCECITRAFVTEKTAAFETPGHEEIEIALFKLYRHTGKEQYRELAEHFLRQRGLNKEAWRASAMNPEEMQDNTDIYHMTDAMGHAVRALYLYTAMADMVAEENDPILRENVETLFDDLTNHKMYITGGFGSTYGREAITIPYDLPNRHAYSESCCAIAMLRFVLALRANARKAKYGDAAERVLYNNLLSSTSLDGKAFFYTNPLEISLREYSIPSAFRHAPLPITQRVEVFGCSCCPPNINRMLAQIGDIICFADEDGACVEQYISSDITTCFGKLTIDEQYATSGKVTISSEDYHAPILRLRLPSWSRKQTATLNGEAYMLPIKDGYAELALTAPFTLSLDFGIEPRFVASNPMVRENAGRIALTYGPLVYCLEGVDNGDRLYEIEISPQAVREAVLEKDFHHFLTITLPAHRLLPQSALYLDAEACQAEPIRAKFIPYHAFANRGSTDMLIWVRKV